MSNNDQQEQSQPPQDIAHRRHDLDALRAFAMLLGIVLHVGLAYAPGFPWPIQDPNSVPLFGFIYPTIHGFRMPLFFLLSGFFTAMLWRKRGLLALLWHRVKRIALPLLIGLFTIVPAVTAVGAWIADSNASKTKTAINSPEKQPENIFEAAVFGNTEAVDKFLAAGVDVDVTEPVGGGTPLSIAALFGHVDLVEHLLQRGADVSKTSYDGGTALINAAFLGRDQIVELLLDAGADPQQANSRGEAPLDTIKADWAATQFIAGLLKVPVDKDEVEAGRERAAVLLSEAIGAAVTDAAKNPTAKYETVQNEQTGDWITQTEQAVIAFSKRPWVAESYFHHLWFLWFLCLFVIAFVPYVALMNVCRGRSLPTWVVLSPVRFLYLVPITFIPAWFMGLTIPGFGPDTSTGRIPMPPVLIYYAVFFFFGAIYFDADQKRRKRNTIAHDKETKTDTVGSWWWFTLPAGLLVVMPVAMGATWGDRSEADPRTARAFAIFLQVLYTWTMTFGLIGLCRRVLSKQRPWVRYISDSSYWLYLMHVPLVLISQQLLKDVDLHGGIKFVIVFAGVTGVLLVVYEYCVRYTPIGTLLNGPRTRPAKKSSDAEGEPSDTPQPHVAAAP